MTMSRGEHMHGIAGLRNRLVVIAWTAALAAAPPAAAGLLLTDPGSDLYYTTALAAGTEIKVDKLCVVVGDVHSNKKVQVETEGRVEGDVVAAEQADVKGTVTGTVTSPAPARELPLLLTEAQARALADRVFEDDHDFVDAVIDDVVFVDGKGRFFGSVGGVGTVIASGDLEVMTVEEGSGLALLGPSARLSLIAFKHVKVLEFRAVRGALYAGGDVILEKGTWFEGTAVANGKVDVKEGTRVEYSNPDREPPVIVEVQPGDGSWVRTASLPLTVVYRDDLSGVAPGTAELSVDGFATVVGAGEEGLVLDLEGLGEGSHLVSLRLRDRAGNEASSTWSFGVDTVPPGAEILSPEPGFSVTAAQPGILVTLEDASSGVSVPSFRAAADGISVTTCEVVADAALCELPPLGSGAHSVAVEVADVAGNVASQQLDFELLLDAEPPEIVIATPQPDSLVRQASLVVSGTATDDSGVLTSVLVDGTPAALAGSSFTATVGLVEGRNQVSVEATDSVGRSSQALLTVRLDSRPPTLFVEAPQAGLMVNSGEVEVRGRARDESPLRVTVDGAEIALSEGAFSQRVAVAEGENLLRVRAEDAAGNHRELQRTVTRLSIPEVAIISPQNLVYLAAPVVDVHGLAGADVTQVTVNGVTATLDAGSFVAAGVPLVEGGNVITATARSASGRTATASIDVVRDLEAPHLAVVVPRHRSVVYAPSVTVTGLVNDIVAGTVNVENATVRVDGIPAEVLNRSFLAADVPLEIGTNEIGVVAEDRAGNVSSTSVTVTRLPPLQDSHIEVVSGQGQSGVAGSLLVHPLSVALKDATGAPVAGEPVLFKVASSDGHFGEGRRQIAVLTDAAGEAAIPFTLGHRAGAGYQRVEALASGFRGRAVFTFRVLPGAPEMIVVDAGGQQKGVVGQQLPRPLIATVTDEGFNRLSGVPVRFEIVSGDGWFLNGEPRIEVLTDSDGRAIAPVVLGPDPGVANNVVRAVLDAESGARSASFTASGLVAGDPAETRITGIVLDNTDVPVAGATIRVRDTSIVVQTGPEGRFEIADAPVGTVKLIVDGTTAQRPGAWPDLEFVLTTVVGQENRLDMPIYLLPLDLEHGVHVTEQTGGTVTLPDFPGFALEIAPGSVTFPGGSRSGLVSATVVHSDRVPMVPNFGQQPRFIVTIQPAGARFDPPAKLTLPNVEGLSPGWVTELYSFDHDLGHFVSIGPGTVSEDGSLVASDPGVGILEAGWHCGGSPSTSGTTHKCPECEKCEVDTCVPDPNANGSPCTDDGDDCTLDLCSNGSCIHPKLKVAFLTLEVNPTEVRPGGSTTVRVSAVPPCPGEQIDFEAEAVDGSGGHVHTANRPVGTLSPASCTTDAQGECQVQYTATAFGGVERIRATSGTAEGEVDLDVLVPGLAALGGGNFVLIGATGTHPDNHYGTAATLATLATIANQYNQMFPAAQPLNINDVSLERGGLFDIRGNWSPPHRTHREGLDADLRSWTIPLANRAAFVAICTNNGVNPVLEYPGGNNEHYHLNF